MSDILTAVDIDERSSSISKEIESSTAKYIKSRVVKELNKIRRKYSEEGKEFDINEHKQRLYNEIANDQDTNHYRQFLEEEITTKIENYSAIRSQIDELNELHFLSAEIERLEMQGKMIKPFRDLVQLSVKNIGRYNKYCEVLNSKFDEFIKSVRELPKLNFKKHYNNLFSEEDPLEILLAMRKLYTISKDIDGLELYDMFNMMNNIEMSNLLSDICFWSKEDNLINILNTQSGKISSLFEKKIISNRLLGILLRNSTDRNNEINPPLPLVTNNSVTCYDSTYITTTTNNKMYPTRTIGELLFEIINDDNKYIDKTERKQIYMTYDGTRPFANEYYKWNGLQVFDIDLKEWIARGNNINKLRNKLYESLQDFHWFLWICLSSSGKGIHIYTKVAPPHHIYLKDQDENNEISTFYYVVNYHSKSSVIYDIIYDIRKEFGFIDSDFIESTEQSKYETGFELKYLDNSVGRITSGIRLTYDPNVMVNPNFLDLPIGLNLCQTAKGFDYKKDIDNILLRKSTVADKFYERMQEMLEAHNSVVKAPHKSSINISEYVLQGYDISKYKEMPLSMIKYRVRYEVCNTLADMFGKDGLQLAHMVLRSEECKNVNEINAFYSSAIRNHKKASKFGLDILQQCGVVKSVDKEFNEELVDKYKLFLKKQIEKSIKLDDVDYDIRLKDNEFIGHREKEVLSKLRSDKINLIYAAPSVGKCFAKDTPILMFDGSIKMVQDIQVGDLLMGPDSKPRRVLSLARGREQMLKVIPKRFGEPFITNRSHIHSMIMSGDWRYNLTEHGPKIPSDDIIYDLTYDDYLCSGGHKIEKLKMFRVGVEFPHKEHKLSSYFLGLWLGDGCSRNQGITVGIQDLKETRAFLEGYAKKLGMEVHEHIDKKNINVSILFINKSGVNKHNKFYENYILSCLREYDLIMNKHIPQEYLTADRKSRLYLMAGLIDSDGYLQRDSIGFVNKSEKLVDDVCYLARSLGYGASKHPKVVNGTTYWRMSISGDFSDLPLRIKRKKPTQKTKMNPLVTGFDFELLPEDDYYGFVIDGDKRFLLGDFTVTHNTEFVKDLARQKRVMLVLPFISVIKNKIESDETIMELFDCYYDNKDISKIEHGINAVTTFDKFSRASYEKISRMFDYIVIDEEHLLFNSQYRINTTSNAVKKLRQLLYISSNDPFAAKIILMTGTPTGSEFFFKNNGNFIRIYKKLMKKTMEFHICDDILDTTTRLAYKVYQLIEQDHKIIIPTNKGDIYTEKMIGMVRHLLQREVKYGYYKRSNNEQEIVSKINNENTVGDYEIVFCSNYLSVGIDINDTAKPFAVLYCGNWSGFEIEQFNSRIRRQDIKSYYFVKTIDNAGHFDELLYEEPKFQLRLTKEDIANFKDDKAVAEKKQEFIAQYDPVLHTITTPGFSTISGQIRFNQEEYELTNFENKYSECYQHPLRVASTLAKYGYEIKVSTQFDGLDADLQHELKQVGIDSAKEEKMLKNDLLIGTFKDLININKYVSEETALEFNNTIEYIIKNSFSVVEDRDMMDCYVKVVFNPFAQPEKVFVRSKVALDKMLRPAHYLVQRYSTNKCMDIIDQYIDTKGLLRKKNFMRAINLLKLVEAHGNNELSAGVEKCIEEIYDYVDKFVIDSNLKVSYSSHMNFLDNLTNNYISYLGLTIRTRYGFDKLRDSVVEIFRDIAVTERSGKDVKFRYNKLPDQDSYNIINRRSVDILIEKMFAITNDIVTESRINPKERHIELETQSF